MAQQKIQLRKIRDFGENFSDTFQFIRQEFKPLALSFMLVALVFVIGISILASAYQQHLAETLGSINAGNDSLTNVFSLYNSTFFLILGLGIIGWSTMIATVAVYMKLYNENDSSPSIGQIWQGVLTNLLKIVIFGIMSAVLITIGCFFCLFPGIYLAVVFFPFSFIIVNENLSIGQTFSRCFELIKENFWISVAIYLVVCIIIFIIALSVSLVLNLILGAGAFFTTQNIPANYTLITTLSNLINYFFYIIMYVSVGLHYYNLVETRDGTGLAKRLEGLGSNVNPNENVEEQY